ncbi:Tripartite tricarboxylate transporter TctB family protein [Natronincola peptidivorans]|uniref:Tripartite tricarboxylate transporter TctB family protein n=1 Tax=Natronincola peptidivorans TaxID=426128 RepID=A0A1I0CB77_9FIRM|nr:tripartite tricarboxylate transporter TctB family protein [Natronincola peptidivorans]SET16765.1 Tripartite tricarboxylate transporter TctB family protein [Natronincola peptidivorans]
MKRIIHHDIYIGTIMLLLSIAMFREVYTMPEGPAQFPKIILSLFAFFSLYVLFLGIKKTKVLNDKYADSSKEKEENLTFTEIKMPLLTFLVIAGYVVVISLFGFFAATTLFMVSFMWTFKVRSWKIMILNTLGINLFIYLLFVLQLNVRLPKGLFF